MTKTPNINLNVPDYQDERWDIPVNENWNLLDTAIAGKQDVATAVNYDNITNCITEIPQDIKLELNNGTLTLKAGSKVYVPNGFDTNNNPKYDVITIASDKRGYASLSHTRPCFMYYIRKTGVIQRLEVDVAYSGATDPVENVWHIWYDTTNNISFLVSNTGDRTEISLPFAIVTFAGDGTTTITSIDQVFNGFGYIGSTIFALPGVKGLIPNGRNADGSLKNTEFETSSVITNTTKITFTDSYVILKNDNNMYALSEFLVEDRPSRTPTVGRWLSYYSPLDNKIYQSDNGNPWTQQIGYIVGIETSNGTRVTSLTPKTAFHAVDYNDFSDLKDTVDTKANDSDVVKLTGNQTVTGEKTFSSNILATSDILVNKNVAFGSNSQTLGLSSYTNNNKLASLFQGWTETSRNVTGMYVFNSSGGYAGVTVSIDENGNQETYAPTPATSDNSPQISTTAFVRNVLETIYPVGSIYIGIQAACPLSSLFGTWVLVSSGRVLQGASAGHNAGTTIEAGLPNIYGRTGIRNNGGREFNGCFYGSSDATGSYANESWASGAYAVTLDASRSSSIYGKSSTVQPPAYVVNIWQRTA